MIGKGENYTTGSLLDYNYYKKKYKLICCDLSKQKVLDSNPKAINRLNLFINLTTLELLLEPKREF